MPDQNATAGDNAGNTNNSDTSTGNKNEGQPNSSNTSNDNKQNEGANNPPAEKTFTQEEVNSLLAKERKAAEKKAADADAKAKLSDDERKDAELAEARAQLRERDTRDAVIEAASAAGVKNPRLFYNAYKTEIETDEKTGKITNLKDVLAQAKTEAPELFDIKKADGSADGGAGKNASDAKPEFASAHDRLRYAYENSAKK